MCNINKVWLFEKLLDFLATATMTYVFASSLSQEDFVIPSCARNLKILRQSLRMTWIVSFRAVRGILKILRQSLRMTLGKASG